MLSEKKEKGSSTIDNSLIKKFKNKTINLAKFARKMYPKMTPAGAQGYFRKQVNGLEGKTFSEKDIKKMKSIASSEGLI